MTGAGVTGWLRQPADRRHNGTSPACVAPEKAALTGLTPARQARATDGLLASGMLWKAQPEKSRNAGEQGSE